jgi:hypothetical protein
MSVCVRGHCVRQLRAQWQEHEAALQAWREREAAAEQQWQQQQQQQQQQAALAAAACNSTASQQQPQQQQQLQPADTDRGDAHEQNLLFAVGALVGYVFRPAVPFIHMFLPQSAAWGLHMGNMLSSGG